MKRPLAHAMFATFTNLIVGLCLAVLSLAGFCPLIGIRATLTQMIVDGPAAGLVSALWAASARMAVSRNDRQGESP